MNSSTNEQQAVIDSDSPNILCVAGPGSGKSTTLVARIKRLVAAGADPAKMVALSFTNTASGVLQERLGEVKIGVNSTLHGFALRCLKRYGEDLGFGSRLALIGEEAAEALMEAKARTMNCKTPLKKLMKAKADWLAEVGRMTATEIARQTTTDMITVRAYCRDLEEGGMVDFDTILSEFLKLINAGKMPALYSHLFVDEVQDSAAIDWKIYQALPIANKFYVGDEDQSIYGFRGGRPDLMHQPAADVFLLQANYRSKFAVCQAAQRLIEHTSAERYPKAMIATRGEGGDVMLWSDAENSGQEVADVAEAVGKEVAKGTLLDEIAVLARTNAICLEVREHLKASGFQVSEKVKDVNPFDWRLAKSLVELAANPANDTLAYFYLVERDGRGMADAQKRKAQSEMRQISALSFGLELLATLSTVGRLLASQKISAETRMRVATIIRTLPADADLLELVLAMTQDEGAAEGATPGITVTTIHQAKGREWDVVFVAGVEEEVLIFSRGGQPDPAVVDESRRLMYVAVTRARESVYLTYAKRRKTSWGSVESHRACRFIREMGL